MSQGSAELLWRLRRLGTVGPLRRVVKAAARQVFREGRVYRIPMGPLRGMRWVMHRDHQFWMPLGAYETETAAWLWRSIQPGHCFYDVGANAGYFTLLASRRVGAGGSVEAFEPVPVNLEILARQVELNALANVSVNAVALTSCNGSVAFTVEDNNANSHLASVEITHARTSVRETLTVQARRLDDWVRESGRWPDVIKIDVEGAEAEVLRGAEATLREQRSLLLVSTHSAVLREECTELLERAGYRVESLPGFSHELVATPNPAVGFDRPRA